MNRPSVGQKGKIMSKFKDDWDEHVYGLTLDGDTGEGDVGGPVGWFAAVTLQPDNDGPSVIEHYGTPYLIVHQGNEGFVTVLPFEKQTDRDVRIGELQRAHALGEAGVTDQQIRLAIDNYLQAAVFTGTHEGEPLDGKMLSWSPAAQRRAAAEVTDFVTENIDEIQEWMQNTGHTWEQVGIDFSLTRNRHGAGFWSRNSAGGSGQVLTEIAHHEGGVTVIVNEQGEMDFA